MHRLLYAAIRKTSPKIDAFVKFAALSNCEVIGRSQIGVA